MKSGQILLCPHATMPWSLLYVWWTVLLSVALTNSIQLPPIHWNSSNPMFKTSNNDHIIEVQLNDEIDFVCPYFEESTNPNQHEYYIIYQVTRREYSDCNLYTSTTANMIVNCSTPKQRKRFTIIFEKYSAIPNGQEFTEGGTYYYITTSSGMEEGLMNQHQGACVSRNMRLTIKVCCDKTTNDPATHRFNSPAISSNTTSSTWLPVTEPAAVSSTRGPDTPPLTHKPLTSQTMEAPKTQLPTTLPSTVSSKYPRGEDTDPPFAWWKTTTKKPWGDTKWPPGFKEEDKKESSYEENETFPHKEGYTGGSVKCCPSVNFLLLCVILWTCILVRR